MIGARWRAGVVMVLLAASVSGAPVPFRVESVVPHDPTAFTQGLVYHEGRLYESTGLRGHSQVRELDPTSGRVLRRRKLDARLFGEGLARVHDRLFQLTWTAGQGFVYALDGLEPLAGFRYRGEGWGLAYDGRVLWMSDGSHRLQRRSPFGFRPAGDPLPVRFEGRPVARLNELEYIEGRLFANVWQTDRIAIIDPSSGQVVGWLDLQGLLEPAERARADVLNGIAWDPERRRLLVTGKLWPKLFILELLAP